jgi:hypothetical protein
MVDEMVAIVGCKGGVLLVTMDQTRIDYLKRQKDLVTSREKRTLRKKNTSPDTRRTQR